jgi:anti-anti-sigma regulatory factor
MNALTSAITTTPACFNTRRCKGWILLSVAGDLDELGVQELERQFARVVTQSLFVAVEMSGVVVADDSLEDVLSGMDRLLRVFGGRFVVLGPRRGRRPQSRR